MLEFLNFRYYEQISKNTNQVCEIVTSFPTLQLGVWSKVGDIG